MARARLQISMSHELEVALRDLQDATGLAMASFVSEVMEHNVEMIKGVTEAARIAKGQPSDWMLEMIKTSMYEAMRRQGLSAEVIQEARVVKPRPYTRRKPEQPHG